MQTLTVRMKKSGRVIVARTVGEAATLRDLIDKGLAVEVKMAPAPENKMLRVENK